MSAANNIIYATLAIDEVIDLTNGFYAKEKGAQAKVSVLQILGCIRRRLGKKDVYVSNWRFLRSAPKFKTAF